MRLQEAIQEAIYNWEFIRLEKLMEQKIGPHKSEYGQLPLFEDDTDDSFEEFKKLMQEEIDKDKIKIDLTQPFIAKQTPHRCPVCSGTGTVDSLFYHTNVNSSAYNMGPITCKSCGGSGVLWN